MSDDIDLKVIATWNWILKPTPTLAVTTSPSREFQNGCQSMWSF